MIGRLTQRSQFDLLRSVGVGRRSGPLRARVVVEDSQDEMILHLGFTIGRKFGSAVERNRMRRRIRHCTREVLRDLTEVSEPTSSRPVRLMLVGADRVALDISHAELLGHCRDLIATDGNFHRSPDLVGIDQR